MNCRHQIPVLNAYLAVVVSPRTASYKENIQWEPFDLEQHCWGLSDRGSTDLKGFHLTRPKRIYNPITAIGFWQCLPFSWTTLRCKHCRQSIAVMGVVDTFEPSDRGLLPRRGYFLTPHNWFICTWWMERLIRRYHLFKQFLMLVQSQSSNCSQKPAISQTSLIYVKSCCSINYELGIWH